MRRRLPAILLSAALLGPIWAADGTSGDEPVLQRLAGLARLWGAVKFCHPRPALESIDWDAALIEALPRVRAARSAAEYREALSGMLSVLRDPATAVGPAPSPPDPDPPKPTSREGGERHPRVELTEDGIAVLIATDYTHFADASTSWILMFTDFGRAFGEAAAADRVLIDLRALKGSAGYLIGMTVPRFFPRLLDGDVALPPLRFLSHTGYPSQREATFAYHSDLTVRSGGVIRAQGRGRAVPEKIVFLINRGSGDFYTMLSALQESGRAVVINEGEPAPAAGLVTRQVALPDGLEARVRCAEPLLRSGEAGFKPALNVSEDATAAGLALLRGERPWPRPEKPGAVPAPSLHGFSLVENSYPEMTIPDRNYRTLALFRFWNIIEYFFPYKDLMDHSWDDILTEFIPRMDAAGDARAYVMVVAELVARIQDSHGTIGSPLYSEYFGAQAPALRVDFIAGLTVITRIADPSLKEMGLAVGDVVLAVDGESIGERRSRLARFIPASTPGRLEALIDMRLLSGAEDVPARLLVEKSTGERIRVDAPRSLQGAARARHEPSLPVTTILPEGFGYIDLGRLKAVEAAPALEKVKDCPGLVLDMRGYPVGGNMPLAQHLASRRVAFARLDFPEFDGATGTFRMREQLQYLDPVPGPEFDGPIVMLVHASSQSAAEHTCLMLEAARDVTFVGSPSSGADGNITYTFLPGGIAVGFTGMGVRHGDGRQLQRMGIQPHVTVRPTLAGIREGRDEVLEKGIETLLSKIGKTP